MADKSCGGCHVKFEPLAFALEPYDGVGAHRTEDNGYPVDTSAAPLIGGEPVPVGGALELIDALADSPSVHACYARHWLEYLQGRPEADEDAAVVARLGEQSVTEAMPIKQLLREVVTSTAFLTRSSEELP